MDQSPNVPARRAASPRGHWTPAKQRIFLAALLETGNAAQAARAAGMSPSSAHRLRLRLAGTPFARTWDQVMRKHAGRLADPFGHAALPAPRPAGIEGVTTR